MHLKIISIVLLLLQVFCENSSNSSSNTSNSSAPNKVTRKIRVRIPRAIIDKKEDTQENSTQAMTALKPQQIKYKSYYGDSVFYTLLFLFVLLLLSASFMMIRDFIQKFLDSNLTNTLNVVLKDIMVFISLGSIIQILNYFSLLHESLKTNFDVNAICIYIAIFSVLWLMLGFYNVIISQYYSNVWHEHEGNIHNRNQIYRQYETLELLKRNGELNASQLSEFKNKREALEYFLIRQEFIAPTFIPTLSENFLRDDFHLNKYFSKAIAATSKKIFKIKGTSLLIIMFLSIFWILFSLIPNSKKALLL